MNNLENSSVRSTSSDEISLKDLLLKLRDWYRYLLSKWMTILAVGILGGLLGLIYASFKNPVYTATTTFVLEDSETGGGLSQYAGLASMAGIDLGGGGGIFQGDNLLELYKSRTMIEKTLLSEVVYEDKKQLLIDHYLRFNKLREVWDEDDQLKNIQFNSSRATYTRLQDSILGKIVDDINKNYLVVAKPDKKLNIIKADVKAEDEFFAKSFNEKIVQNVNDFYVQTKTKKSLDNVSILQMKVDSVRAVMNRAIYAAATVSDATPNLNPTRQTQRVAPVQRSQFSAETNKAILSTLIQNLEMSKMSLLKEAPLIQVVDKPIFPLKREKLGKAKGIIIGCFLAGLLTCLFLITRKLFQMILS